MRQILNDVIAGQTNCKSVAATECDADSDECAASYSSYRMEGNGFWVTVIQAIKLCSHSSITEGDICEMSNKVLRESDINNQMRDLKCVTKTCTSDGCNAYKAVPAPDPEKKPNGNSASGLTLSIFPLLVCAAAALFKFL